MRFWKSVSAKTAWSPPRTKETVLGRLCLGNGGDRRRPHGDFNNSDSYKFQAHTNFDSAAPRELARHCRPQLTRSSAQSVLSALCVVKASSRLVLSQSLLGAARRRHRFGSRAQTQGAKPARLFSLRFLGRVVFFEGQRRIGFLLLARFKTRLGKRAAFLFVWDHPYQRGRASSSSSTACRRSRFWNEALFCELGVGTATLEEDQMGKGILLWLLGVPIPVIIILGFVLHWW